jgi:hypothetical protein
MEVLKIGKGESFAVGHVNDHSENGCAGAYFARYGDAGGFRSEIT